MIERCHTHAIATAHIGPAGNRNLLNSTPRLQKSSFCANLSLSTPAISLGALRLRGAGKMEEMRTKDDVLKLNFLFHSMYVRSHDVASDCEHSVCT
jgi:hypothetical protein